MAHSPAWQGRHGRGRWLVILHPQSANRDRQALVLSLVSPSHSVQRLSPRAGAGNTHGVRYHLSYSSRDSLFQVCPEVCPEEIRDPVKTTITINHPVAEEWLGEGTLPVLDIGV